MKAFQRFFCFSICALLLFSVIPKASAASAVPISSVKELSEIENNLSGSYYLTGNIKASGKEVFTPIGSSEKPFTGTLDGKGYAITGLTVTAKKNATGKSLYAGLFATNRGTVKNLKLQEIKATAKDAQYAYVGAVAAINIGTIENCYASGDCVAENIEIAAHSGGIAGQMLKGTLKGTSSYVNVHTSGGEQYTGGLCGTVEKGEFSNNAVFASVFANGVNAMHDIYAGGLFGFSRGGNYKDLLFLGGLIAEKCANTYMGGIFGFTQGTVENAVSYGSVTPSQVISHMYMGGIAGDDSSATLKNCYFLKSTVKEELTAKKGKELSADEFKKSSAFSGLDFKKTWEMKSDKPMLRNLPTPNADDPVSKLSGIKIVSKPKKLQYTQGDSALNLTGLSVSAIYTDRTETLKPGDYTVGGYNYITVGTQTITVTYKGFTDSFTITMKKTDKAVIGPTDITPHSYSDGKEDGKAGSKNAGTTSTVVSSTGSKKSTTSGAVAPNGNTVVDNLDDDPTDSTGAIAQNSSGSSEHKGKTPVLLMVVLAVVALCVIAGAAALLILKLRAKKTAEHEVSNDELSEVLHDEHDVYDNKGDDQ